MAAERAPQQPPHCETTRLQHVPWNRAGAEFPFTAGSWEQMLRNTCLETHRESRREHLMGR